MLQAVYCGFDVSNFQMGHIILTGGWQVCIQSGCKPLFCHVGMRMLRRGWQRSTPGVIRF